jgi:hypothetical protein
MLVSAEFPTTKSSKAVGIDSKAEKQRVILAWDNSRLNLGSGDDKFTTPFTSSSLLSSFEVNVPSMASNIPRRLGTASHLGDRLRAFSTGSVKAVAMVATLTKPSIKFAK